MFALIIQFLIFCFWVFSPGPSEYFFCTLLPPSIVSSVIYFEPSEFTIVTFLVVTVLPFLNIKIYLHCSGCCANRFWCATKSTISKRWWRKSASHSSESFWKKFIIIEHWRSERRSKRSESSFFFAEDTRKSVTIVVVVETIRLKKSFE